MNHVLASQKDFKLSCRCRQDSWADFNKDAACLRGNSDMMEW